MKKVFGPIPSRRLGQSLGINNIPPKHCTYACLYCQLGCSTKLTDTRTSFYAPEALFDEVRDYITRLEHPEKIDHLSLVPDGEPTLDIHLGELIDRLKTLGRKVAVVTNASLLWRADVQEDLLRADWVSVKMDVGSEALWKKLNTPHTTLTFNTVQDGIRAFRKKFTGTFNTETLLVRNINDTESNVADLAGRIADLRPRAAYLSMPTRPPTDKGVRPPETAFFEKALKLFRARGILTESLVSESEGGYANSGNLVDGVLGITAVHPMSEKALRDYVSRAGGDWSVIDGLVRAKRLSAVSHEGTTFYRRNFGD